MHLRNRFNCILQLFAVLALLLPVPAISATAAPNDPLDPSIFLNLQELAHPLTQSEARYLLTRSGFVPTDNEIKAITGVMLGVAVNNLVNQANSLAAATPLPAWVPETITAQNNGQYVLEVTKENEYVTFQQDYVNLPACKDLNFQSITQNCTVFTKLNSTQQAAFVTQQNLAFGDVRNSFRNWWGAQLVLTKTPLAERMVLFWHNLFPAQDVQPWWFYNQDMSIRSQALGNFQTLVTSMVDDANMEAFLGQHVSTPAAPTANMARELMELFTLGINGGYTQNDVDAVSFALTGLTIRNNLGVYLSDAKDHASSQQTILGRTCAAPCSPVQALDIIFNPNAAVSPGPGPYVISRLWSEFVSSDPQNHTKEINAIATIFKNNGWSIRDALKGLFLTQAFWSPTNFGTLVKSPAEFVTGIVRSDLDRSVKYYFNGNVSLPSATVLATQPQAPNIPISGVVNSIWASGEPFWLTPNVKGFLTGVNWINTATLVARQNTITSLLDFNWLPNVVEPQGVNLTQTSVTPAQFYDLQKLNVQGSDLQGPVMQTPAMLTPPATNENFLKAVSEVYGDPAYWLK